MTYLSRDHEFIGIGARVWVPVYGTWLRAPIIAEAGRNVVVNLSVGITYECDPQETYVDREEIGKWE